MEIDRYEEAVLANPNATEHDASRFFAQYPKFLFLGVGKELRREVVLVNSGTGEEFRVDFFRRPFGSEEWDIIELKTPGVDYGSAATGQHPRPSAAVTTAINQAHDYRDWILEDTTLRSDLLSRGLLVYRPKLLVVVGRDRSIPDPRIVRRLEDRLRQGPVEAISYDAIMRFAKDHYESDRVIVLWSSIGSDRGELSRDVLLARRVDSLLKNEFPSGKAVLPFSGRGVKWRIDKISLAGASVNLTLFVRRRIEQDMLLDAVQEVFKAELPDIRVNYFIDDSSPLDLFSQGQSLWKKRKDLDGD
jgi:hypothetical protein